RAATWLAPIRSAIASSVANAAIERARGAADIARLSMCRRRRGRVVPRLPDCSILSLMANQSAPLDVVFAALADPTRRAIVGALGRGPASVSTLAAPFAMALPSFMKHLTVLERSGVIRSTKTGRVRTCALRPRALSPAERWMAEQRAALESRSDRMAAFVEELHRKENPPHEQND